MCSATYQDAKLRVYLRPYVRCILAFNEWGRGRGGSLLVNTGLLSVRWKA